MQTIKPLNPILSTLDDIIIEVTLTEQPVMLPINYRYAIVIDYVPFDEYMYGNVMRPSDGSHRALGAYLISYTDTSGTPVVGQISGSNTLIDLKPVSEVFIIPRHNCIHHAHEVLFERLMREYLRLTGGNNAQ